MKAYRIVDTNQMPWGAWHPQFPGTFAKALFDDPDTKVNLRLAFLPGNFRIPKAERHHHGKTREGVFVLFGNVPYREYDQPSDLNGRFFDFQSGFLLDRPPRSIHGISVDPTSKLGCMVLEWGTGPLEFNYVPFESDLTSFGTDYAAPHVADSRAMKWAPHPIVPGWKIKVLSSGGENPVAGYHPSCLVHVPPGWQPGKEGRRGKAAPYRRWFYVVHGDLPLVAYGLADVDRGEATTVTEGCYVEWRDPATLGFVVGAASEIGCVVFCLGHMLAD
ncbi:MAG: hypothetical protein EXQ85_02750 [Alphaproteobacteria bacterium]|nr:hypothetical protein [Alphaproteobacteria bacterium]